MQGLVLASIATTLWSRMNSMSRGSGVRCIQKRARVGLPKSNHMPRSVGNAGRSCKPKLNWRSPRGTSRPMQRPPGRHQRASIGRNWGGLASAGRATGERATGAPFPAATSNLAGTGSAAWLLVTTRL